MTATQKCWNIKLIRLRGIHHRPAERCTNDRIRSRLNDLDALRCLEVSTLVQARFRPCHIIRNMRRDPAQWRSPEELIVKDRCRYGNQFRASRGYSLTTLTG